MIILNKTDKVPREFLVNFLENSMKKGIKINTVETEYEDAKKRMQDAADVLKHQYDIDNPNSSVQLADYALISGDKALIDIVTDNKTKKISFNKANMARLLELDNPFASVLNRYKVASNKLKNITMIQKFVKDNYIHPTVTLQNTNRISYIQPALMNIDKTILWKMVQSRNEGWGLWSVDVKNQEPWIFAHLIGDETLTDIVKETYMRKESFYKIVFERLYGRPVENDYEYKEIKTGWNMLTYGGTKKGLLDICKTIDGAKLYDFLTKLPAYKRYNGECYSKARRGVRTDMTYFGSAVTSDKPSGTVQLARSLSDITIQGTGADILAFLVAHITDAINDDPKLRNRIELYYTRHDELIFMVNRKLGETDEDIKNILQSLSAHMINGWVPFMTDVEKI